MRNVGRRAKVLIVLFLLCVAIIVYRLWPEEPFVGENFSLHKGTDKILIFVHGVLGDPRATFTNSTTNAFWPQLIADDTEMADYDILAVSFDAGVRSKLSIEQIATTLRTTLEDQKILRDYNEIYFITHSMGGLIVKRLLNDLYFARSPVLEQQVSGIVFISTPAKGAEAADYLNMINVIGMRPLVDLRTYAGNTFLQTLENEWKDYVDNRRPKRVPKVFVAYETQPMSGVLVVPQLYADPSGWPCLPRERRSLIDREAGRSECPHLPMAGSPLKRGFGSACFDSIQEMGARSKSEATERFAELVFVWPSSEHESKDRGR